jgi:hypothetical protein
MIEGSHETSRSGGNPAVFKANQFNGGNKSCFNPDVNF